MKSLFVFIAISFFFFSCERTSCENAQAATILDYTGLDGCGLVLKLQSGEVLEPTNLNDFNITPNRRHEGVGEVPWSWYDEHLYGRPNGRNRLFGEALTLAFFHGFGSGNEIRIH